ncbi:MAG: hypothetical protein V1863_04920 [Candidatus Omnitrophota bacterium]
MGFFLLLISLVIVAKGIGLILWPKKMMKVAHRFLNMKEPRIAAVIALFVGILLLLAVSRSILGWLIVLLGLAEVGAAVYIFMTPIAKIRNHRWWNLSDTNYRVLGILTLLLGVIIFVSRV